MGWVSWPLVIFLFLAPFSALWWPNIWPKMGFPELFKKSIGSIHFIYIPGMYPYGVSLLTPIHFCVPSLIFGPLVAKYLAENGVSKTFRKNYQIEIFVGYFWMRWVVIRAGVYCPHLWAQLVEFIHEQANCIQAWYWCQIQGRNTDPWRQSCTETGLGAFQKHLLVLKSKSS